MWTYFSQGYNNPSSIISKILQISHLNISYILRDHLHLLLYPSLFFLRNLFSALTFKGSSKLIFSLLSVCLSMIYLVPFHCFYFTFLIFIYFTSFDTIGYNCPYFFFIIFILDHFTCRNVGPHWFGDIMVFFK